MAEKKSAAKTAPRLKELYNSELKAKLQKELKLKNIKQVPELKNEIAPPSPHRGHKDPSP